MSVQTLLFFVLLLQVALIVIVYRKERHILDALNRAQSQNARWLSDVKERLRDEIRGESASPTPGRDAPRYRDSEEREFTRPLEDRTED